MLVPSLYQFFRRQLQHGFHAQGLAEPATVDYVSEMLARFACTPAMYLIRDDDGRPIDSLVGLMIEWRRAQGWDDAQSDAGREALVARHIGEYALFMSGLFRERLAARGQLRYYQSHGRSAYWHCADREFNPNRARVYWSLSQQFERVSTALNHIRERQLTMDVGTAETPSPLAAFWNSSGK
ncbi:MAG TPA: hypothetical protein VGA00_02725 [Acidiferrobacterales bacterium]